MKALRIGDRICPSEEGLKSFNNWQGRTGFVHQAVLDDYSDLSAQEIYACGAPIVVEAAHRDFTTLRGLPNESFFSDAFTFTPKS